MLGFGRFSDVRISYFRVVNNHFPGQITGLAKCAKEIMQLEKFHP